MNTISFKLNGIACSACVKLISNRFNKIEGVNNVDIDVLTGEAKITSDNKIDLGMFSKAIEGLPYSIAK